MLRACILLVSLIACINLIGCSKGPSNKDASNLAFSFLSGMIPGITEKEISILKTLEKEGNTIVVVQAGEMLCNMPVIKRKDGWIASGILCNGQFEPPEKAAIRALNAIRDDIKTEIDQLNNKGPYTSEDGNVRYNKAEFENNVAAYYITLLNTNAMDCTNKIITEKIKPLINSLCSDSESKELLIHDISYKINSYDSDGNLSLKHIINRDICNNKLYCL
jgi:hypothetical protein